VGALTLRPGLPGDALADDPSQGGCRGCREVPSQGFRARGFTVVELMVSVAIAAILITVGLPAFNGFIGQQRLTTYTNDMVAAVAYARSEAAKLGGVVSVQALVTGDDGNEWGGGYCVVAGNPGNCNGTPLRRVEAPTAVTLDAVGGLDGIYALSFNSRGILVGGVGGSVQICSTDAGVTEGRTLGINVIGRTLARELTCN
jgi:type IV fimbrial biogenesis protein FimT